MYSYISILLKYERTKLRTTEIFHCGAFWESCSRKYWTVDSLFGQMPTGFDLVMREVFVMVTIADNIIHSFHVHLSFQTRKIVNNMENQVLNLGVTVTI